MKDNTEKITFGKRLNIIKSELKEDGFADKPAVICYLLLVIGILVYAISRVSSSFAEFWTRSIGSAIRCITGSISSVVHFSIGECVVVCLPVAIVLILVSVVLNAKHADTPREIYRPVISLLCAVCIIASLFLTCFGPSYFRKPLEDNIGIEKTEVSATELYETAVIVSDKLEAELENIEFVWQKGSVMPYSYSELVEKMNVSYAKYCENVDYIKHFYSYPKAIALSEPMTYTHISGVYTFFSGESNININYPDFILPYTMAHEMAHQRGIAAEDEANFVAYLVCIQSDDAYIRYSAYANMYNYLRNALYKADKDMYNELASLHYPSRLVAEYSAYSKMFAKYSSSTASAVTQTVNNFYLTTQGQTSGTASYGLVVDLAVAYYKING